MRRGLAYFLFFSATIVAATLLHHKTTVGTTSEGYKSTVLALGRFDEKKDVVSSFLSNLKAGIEVTYCTGLNISTSMVRNNMRQGIVLGLGPQFSECTDCSITGNQVHLNSREEKGKYSEIEVGYGSSNTRMNAFTLGLCFSICLRWASINSTGDSLRARINSDIRLSVRRWGIHLF